MEDLVWVMISRSCSSSCGQNKDTIALIFKSCEQCSRIIDINYALKNTYVNIFFSPK